MTQYDEEKVSAGSDPTLEQSSDTAATATPPNGATEEPKSSGPERTLSGWKWFLAVFAILSSTFLFALDTTVVADIQPDIIERFGEIDKLPWLAASFTLPAATLQLPWAKMYGVFNVKWLYISHVLLFEIGSAIQGASPSMNALIIGRAIAGIGGSGMYIGGLTYLSITTTEKERAFYVSLVTPVWGLGTVLGPVVGGGFAISSATWRWGLYINLVIAALVAPVYFFILPPIDPQPTQTVKQKLKQIDHLGTLVFVGFGLSFIMAISFGGSVYEWKSPSEIVLWVMTGVLLIAFCLTQWFHPFVSDEDKLYPTKLQRSFRVFILQFQTFAGAGIVYIPIYYIPLFFRFTQGDTALEAAVRLLPFIFMIVFFSLIQGMLMGRLKYYMPWFVFGMALSLVGSTLTYTITPDTSASAIYGYSVLIGIGGGLVLLSTFAVAPAIVPPEKIYDAIGLLSVAQGFGLVFFVATAGTIFQNLGVQKVTPFVPPELGDNVRPLIAGVSSELFTQLSPTAQGQVTGAIVKSIDLVYPLSIGASAIALILAPFLGFGKMAGS